MNKDSIDFNIEVHHFMYDDGDGAVHQAVRISMTRNGRTFNCVNHLRCFQDGHSALATLEPVINTLVKNLYPENFSPKAVKKRRIKESETEIQRLKDLIIFLTSQED